MQAPDVEFFYKVVSDHLKLKPEGPTVKSRKILMKLGHSCFACHV